MDVYRKLQSALSGAPVLQGVVVSAAGSTPIIATPEGSFQVSKQAGDVTDYKRLDTVSIRNGFLVGVVPSSKNSIRYVIR